MNVLVTGASGFLGQHLCRALIVRGDFVFALVRDHQCKRDHVADGRTIVYGDVRKTAIIERILVDYAIDAVVHLAAQAQVSIAEANPTDTLDTNVRGTWSVLEACRRQHVKRVVCASSDKAYGAGAVPYVETQPLLPHGVYATSKAMADMLAQAYQRDFKMPIAITRCANLYGPGHENFSTLIPGTIRSLLRGERPVIRSDGTPRRDYLYVADAVAGYLKLLDSDVTGAWNFGSGRSWSAIEVVKMIAPDVEPDIQGTARGEIDEQWVSTDKARGLGWEPQVPFEQGLSQTILWYGSRYQNV